ncbi:MAG: VCBS repeat-containing protein [Verrucomicrobia bacterium]|nr:VCBS repeat-containing protein [Verrucomicrobiota bacterium]
MRQPPTNGQATLIWPGPIHRRGRLIRLAPIAWSVVIGLGFGLSEPDAAGAGATDPDPLVRALEVAPSARPGFTRMTPAQTGIAFTNLLAESRYLTNQIYLNGSGLALGDVDGDGRCDLYFCGLDGSNALYRNLGGWRFTNITASAGVACEGQASTGAVLVDIDGDHDLDLLVNGVGVGTRLFLGDGKGRFHEATESSGLLRRGGSTSLALADIDGDGDLDLYVANYRSTTLRDEPNTRFRASTISNQLQVVAVNGRPTTEPDLVGRFTIDPVHGILEHGEADLLYRNLGNGRFEPVDWTGGTFLDDAGRPAGVPYDWTLSAMFRDFNQDGAPDLFVCSDFQSEDRLWLNDGQGRFRRSPAMALRHMSLFTMGLDVADVDRDGHDDFFAADMLSRQHDLRMVQLGYFNPFMRSAGRIDSCPQYSRNMLFWNRGDGTYTEVAQLAGVEASDWTWSPVFLDVDGDGFEDLLTVTGHARDAQNIDVARQIDDQLRGRTVSALEHLTLRRMFPPLHTPNFAFRNRGDLTFEERGSAWGFDATEISQGIALGDLDGDGDLDVAINCLNAGPLLYRNKCAAPRVAVRLRGQPGNTGGVGARIVLRGGAVPFQSQEMISGGRYLSSDDLLRVFAAGNATNRMSLEVQWRGGRTTVVPDVRANQLHVIREPATAAPARSPLPEPAPWFVEAGPGEPAHVDPVYDDFQRQPLLPHALSQLGPGVGWYDLDGDGRDELVVGSGQTGRLSVWRHAPATGFVPARQAALRFVADHDQTTILGWQRFPGRRGLLIGVANYEEGLGPAVRLTDPSANSLSEVLGGQASSPGPLALGDWDGDGDLDLFVGGRVVPGRYPEPASSILLVNEGNDFPLASNQALDRCGLVSGALWSDLDGDGYPELVLACEWGPIRVYRREAGRLREITDRLGLSRYAGWWNSVHAGDFDGDGRLDLVAGNWGRNTRYQSSLNQPARVYYGDLDGDDAPEIIEAYFAPELGKLVPWRDWETLSKSIPSIVERFDSFTAFSQASVADILGSQIDQMRELSVNTAESMVFLNRGDRFEARPLPIEAQVSPVFGITVGDFDGDGHEDLVVCQNFFRVSADVSRHDGGRGLWLRGDGQGGFHPVPGAECGIAVYGEGRGLAAADFDQDGRLDLAVGQNSNRTLVYRNVRGRPGLRVRLDGPPGNPESVGAVVRLVNAAGQMGPAREVHAGSGYWSQDSSTLVLAVAGAGEAQAIQVRWPGGKSTRSNIPPGASEIRVTRDGSVVPGAAFGLVPAGGPR